MDKIMTNEEWRNLSAESRHKINLFEQDCERTKERLHQVELTLATLCDMVLGEDAPDRSDGALIREVGRLIRHDGFVPCSICECAEAITDNGLCDGCHTAREILRQKGIR